MRHITFSFSVNPVFGWAPPSILSDKLQNLTSSRLKLINVNVTTIFSTTYVTFDYMYLPYANYKYNYVLLDS